MGDYSIRKLLCATFRQCASRHAVEGLGLRHRLRANGDDCARYERCKLALSFACSRKNPSEIVLNVLWNVITVLTYLQVDSEKLREKIGTESVWSIDLAYLLANHGLSAAFYTTNAGVRPEYGEQEFYRRHLIHDTVRVTELFANASKKNVSVVVRETSLDDLRDAVVTRRQLVLVLLDKRLLRCERCSPAPRRFANCTRTGFLGHYVLLTHFHHPTDVFLMKDSSRKCTACVVRADVLESARSAFGTDLDTICVDRLPVKPSHSFRHCLSS